MVAPNARENGQRQRKADPAVRTQLKGGYKENRGALSTRSHVEKTSSTGYELHQERTHLNKRGMQ